MYVESSAFADVGKNRLYIYYIYVTHYTVYMYAIFTPSVHIVYSYDPGEDSEMRGKFSNGACEVCI